MTNPRQPDHAIDSLFTDRWSPRAYSGESIPEADLLRLLEAARWAPSGYNLQPWRFVYAHRNTPSWQPIFGSLVEFNQGWAQHAAALVVLISAQEAVRPGTTDSAPNPSHSFDAGAAWVSLAFQATLLGWSAHGMAGFDHSELRSAIGVPDNYVIEAVIAIGKRAEKEVLPDYLHAGETPNSRRPLALTAAEGRFNFAD